METQTVERTNFIDSLIVKKTILDNLKDYNESIQNMEKLIVDLSDVEMEEKEQQILNTQKEELNKVKSEYKDFIDKSLQEYKSKKVVEDFTLLEIIKDIEVKIATIKDNQSLRNLYRELSSSYNLRILIDANDKKYDMQDYKKNWLREFNKFRNNLAEEKEYKFKDPIEIPNVLKKFIEEDDVDFFLYSLCRFLNPKRKKGIKKYAIFISELINNIYSLIAPTPEIVDIRKLDEIELRRSILPNIKDYISFIKNKQ